MAELNDLFGQVDERRQVSMKYRKYLENIYIYNIYEK
jgi:hypothetical protein